MSLERVAWAGPAGDDNAVILSREFSRACGVRFGERLAVWARPSPPDKRRLVGACRAWPSPRVKQAQVRLQSKTLSLSGVSIGSKIELARLGSLPAPARAVTLSFTSKPPATRNRAGKRGMSSALSRYVRGALVGSCVLRGALVSISLGGTPVDCRVIHVDGGDSTEGCDALSVPSLFHITRDTRFTLARVEQGALRAAPRDVDNKAPRAEEKQAPPVRETRFADIGGLNREIKSVRDVIETPLLHPAFFSRFGVRPPKGVLLFGPAGTGKTMVARAVAAETKAHFIAVNSPEIVGRFVGESEAALRGVFRNAEQNAPSIIFFDEIDAICPRRDSSASAFSKRLVACLLSLMDGVGSSDRVAVIAATNRPNALDPALRRPGRFDREVEIGIPNESGRLDILSKLLGRVPHSLTPDNVAAWAGDTHGYVGADLRALCQEASFSALRRAGQRGDARIGQPDFEAAFARVQPSAMREVYVDVPKVTWTDVGGQWEVKQRLKEAVEWPLRHPEAFRRLGVRPPKGILLYGPPGCSKTLMAKALANESKRNFIAVKGPELLNMWVGESEKAVRDVFAKARAASPSIVFFDEIDSLAVRRGAGAGGARAHDRVLGQLLSELDGVEGLKDVVVVAATNRPDLLDPAILRPGRIDRVLYVAPPDTKSRQSIFRLQLAKMAHAPQVDPVVLADRSKGFSGAEVCAVCQRAAASALKENIRAERVEMHHFEAVLKAFKPAITAEVLQWYRRFEESASFPVG